jgi:CRISPR-associated autoregulator DevR family
MTYKSLAMSFRIQLGFHAANNEGAGGTNVMEPRRITVGDKEYDGISGEIIRHHILENFVRLCQQHGLPLHQRCQGLVPDRCKSEVKNWMNSQSPPISKLNPEQHYAILTAKILSECALCDIGGYLVALQGKQDGVEGTLKRDSCFEVGWLITEHSAVVNYTQHSAYDPDPEKHNLFVQNMRIGIYGGVLRIDLDRIGFNDWWWLGDGVNKYAISDAERYKRMWVLLEAIKQWMLSPSFAKASRMAPSPRRHF